MRALRAATSDFINGPMYLLARAHFTEITGKRTDPEETEEGEEFTDTVLERRTSETPAEVGTQSETCLRSTGVAALSVEILVSCSRKRWIRCSREPTLIL